MDQEPLPILACYMGFHALLNIAQLQPVDREAIEAFILELMLIGLLSAHPKLIWLGCYWSGNK
ncbi:MAG: hypothetical protein G3M70_03965 [Candidatus Nitronauta litoralis]|uniref:Uncharacterized protein n=1 Tax=Candidatus Nitronauta litoralis TaxID=2705533 RepID=A0A7T0BUH5_9BACT|nr:MAG: hypothetical protein G3M70_03965 [Candidatus Nitronauta litoralis]